MTIVKLRSVSKSFDTDGAIGLLADINLELWPGTVTALEGRSGSGKTTMLNVILGWESLNQGSVEVAGRTDQLDALGWDVIAVVPQNPTLFPELTVEENVTFPLRFQHRRRPNIDRILAALDLTKVSGRVAGQTSVGEQQRAAVARAVLLRPAVILADEPLAHQDRLHAKSVLDTLRSVAEQGCACLIASHDPMVHAYADRRVQLVDGMLHAAGAVGRLA